MYRSRSKSEVVLLSSLFLLAAACSKGETKPDDGEPTEQSVVAEGPSAAEDGGAIQVEFPAAGITLAGVVNKPAGEGPFPAVAIAAGSGPTDRDWNNPMLPGTNGSAELLAEALADRGIVVLRYDKRGTGKTGMPPAPVTWTDYVAELSQATKFLAEQTYVDPKRIHVAGHSEGGAHALKVAMKPPVPLASVILLSTAGRSLGDIVLWQIGNQLETSGLNEAAVAAEKKALKNALKKIGAGETVDPAKVGQLPGVQQFIAALQSPQSVDFARELLVFQPTTAFQQFDLPVLVLSGARDIQVDPDLDAKPLAEASKAAGRETHLVIVATADHVLKDEPTPRDQLDATAGLRYNADGRQLAAGVVDTLVDWVEQHH